MPTALFIGRFQPLHNAHLKVIKNILKENGRIIIAIGSSQEKHTMENPFSTEERGQMIDEVMKANKIKNYEITEIPDYFDDMKWCGHIKDRIKRFDVAYSGNNYVLNCLKRNGFSVKRIKLIEGINSTKIRQLIKAGGNWKRLVPKEVAKFIGGINGAERIKSLKIN
ncbi:nicotinamide-nucleotide adenylyltransferase [Candidatus Woesearchaeota archaeon]|nr:nicotinamide-nucleotide adenylyltransferase [Candidatus Woesearchaeota archaeon]